MLLIVNMALPPSSPLLVLIFCLGPDFTNGDCDTGALRLINGTSMFEGRVEICYNNNWGTICDDYWSNANARVVCRQLGFSIVGAYYRGSAYYGQGQGSIILDDVVCDGSEASLYIQCRHSTPLSHNCGHHEDVGVVCPSTYNCTQGSLRLVNSSYIGNGRLEICVDGEWGTVCDNGWTNLNAQVVCKQVGQSTISGYQGGLFYSNAYYGKGTGSIFLDNVQCTGTEDRLINCSHSSINGSSCDHSDDVSVFCFSETRSTGTIILSRNNVQSSSYYYGVVRVWDNGWGNICDDNYYSSAEANVICHQLGYTGASSYSRAGLVSYGTDYLPMEWDDVNCASSSYLSIAQCSYSTYIDIGCTNSNSYDATVYCYSTRIWDSNPFPGMIRLQGGDYSNEGRVEVYCNGQWGTICSTGFNSTDANTICKQLGYDSYLNYSVYPSNTSQPIWSTNMYSLSSDVCYGTRNGCPATSVTSCSHLNDIFLECRENNRFTRGSSTILSCSHSIDPVPNATNGALILSRNNVSSTSYYYGIVRVYYNGWGNICYDSYYGYSEADVICHQLGYTRASSYSRAGLVSYGTDYLHMKWDNVSCASRSYLSIAQCSYSTYIDSGCTNSNSYDATVYCYSTRIWDTYPFPGMIRLQGGNYSNEGRVEVYCNGQWGTICSTGFNSTDANTICRQLGYDSYSVQYSSPYSNSSQPIWSRNMYNTSSDRCFGIRNGCPSSSVTSCTHYNHVSIICREQHSSTKYTTTLSTCSGLSFTSASNGTIVLYRNGVFSLSYYSGIVFVYYNGGWGSICADSYYSSTEANVICHQLGYTGASSYSRSGIFSYLPIKWSNVNCASSRYLSIAQCSYSTYIDSGCYYLSDATVYCYSTRIWSNPFLGMIRLQGGAYSSKGRVEVYCNGQWGTLCNADFDSSDATSLCRQLGYDDYHRFNHLAIYGSFSQPIWSSHIVNTSFGICNSTRNNSCPTTSISSCTHQHDVTLQCREVSNLTRLTTCVCESVRLVGGSSSNEGRVEVCRYGFWGTVCDDFWNNTDAGVVCRQLGYISGTALGNAYFGQGTGIIVMDDVHCTGTELTLTSCTHTTNHNCVHSEDAGVRCTSNSNTATITTSTGSQGAIIGGAISGVITLIIIINGIIICVFAIHTKKKSSRSANTNMLAPPATMTTLPRSISATDYEQPQSAVHIYEEQHTCKALPMPHPPLQGFSQHSYPKNTKQGYHLGQKPPLDYEETSFGWVCTRT